MPRHPGRAPKPPGGKGNRLGSHGRKAAEALGRARTPCAASKACSCSSPSWAWVMVRGSSTQIATTTSVLNRPGLCVRALSGGAAGDLKQPPKMGGAECGEDRCRTEHLHVKRGSLPGYDGGR